MYILNFIRTEYLHNLFILKYTSDIQLCDIGNKFNKDIQVNDRLIIVHVLKYGFISQEYFPLMPTYFLTHLN